MKRPFALVLLVMLLLGGCGHMPRFIVLNDPLSAEEHVMLGVGYEQQGEFFLAEKEYGRALKKDSKCFQARVNLGNVALAGREYEAARKQYLRALEIRPGDPEATNNLAMAAILSGDVKRMAEARTRLDALLAADPVNRVPALLETGKDLDAAIARSKEPK
jgi:Flp pilus assembly protein TadD